jgi:hypothetical protein
MARSQPDSSPAPPLQNSPEVQYSFGPMLSPARTACMGGKGVGAVPSPNVSALEIAIPKPAFKAWRCVTVGGTWAGEWWKESPTRFRKVSCWGFLKCFSETTGLWTRGEDTSFDGASTGSSQTGTSIPRVEACTAPRACDSGGTGVVQASPWTGGVRCAGRTANESSGWQTLLEQVYVHLSILHEWWYLWAVIGTPSCQNLQSQSSLQLLAAWGITSLAQGSWQAVFPISKIAG